MTAYYNENDPYAAQWLRNLIAAGHIAEGDVDERSITDVSGADLKGYVQCHFFAGIGGWSLACRLAGIPDDEPIWTGSCPCQPFSAAGRQQGEKDSRHLWPEFQRLIAKCSPATVVGEQVASKLGREWLAGVRVDLEDLGYAVGAADLCAASVGAPHIRQRLYWLADNTSARLERAAGTGIQKRISGFAGGSSPDRLADRATDRRREERKNVRGLVARDSAQGRSTRFVSGGDVIGVANTDEGQRGRFTNGQGRERDRSQARRQQGNGIAQSCGDAGRLGNANDKRSQGRINGLGESGCADQRIAGAASQPSSWSDYHTVDCTDGKTRRFEPGSFPLAHGVSGRVGRLRGYGNAIVPQVAAQFLIAAYDSFTEYDEG